MSAARLRVVARLAPPSTRSRWFAMSLAAHLAVAAALVVWPSRTRAVRGPIGPTIAVDLVAGPPAARRAPPAASKPPAEEAESEPAPKPKPKPKPKEAALDSRDVRVADKPKPTEPEPEPEETAPVDADRTDEDDDARQPGGEPGPAGEESGGPETGVAGDVGGGGTVLGSEYAWYGARVTAALRSNWHRPPLGNVHEPLTVVVAFDILRNGMVRNVRIVESSGVASLDRSALRAVSDAAPLPALPRALDAPTVPARFEFTWYPGES